MTLTSVTKTFTVLTIFLLANGIKERMLAQGLKTPVIKTIKTEYGDTYDCIDFYKQPAFKHPLLKNHSFYPQMRPSFVPKWKASDTKMGVPTSNLQFKDGGCPLNTVPIWRMNKEDISRAKLLSKNIISSRLHSNFNGPTLNPGTHRAIGQTKANTNATYYGVGGRFSLWNPPTKAYQYSSSQFLIQNGQDSIQVGWTVNPILYKDNKTRMFIHTTTAAGSHCFNTYCPGFVIVRSDIPIYGLVGPISTRGGNIHAMGWLVYKDQVNGNWWLAIGEDNTPIGFWPNKIFGGLAEYGSYVESGGETYSSPDKPDGGPPMGTGDFVKGPGVPQWDAYCRNFVVVNDKNQIIDVDDIELFSDSDRYQVRNAGVFKPRGGRVLFFGGPGGSD